MKLKRRDLLKGSAALAAFSSLPKDAKAWLHPGAQLIGHGWNTLPLGAGGLVTGFDIAADNSIVCRTDVGNIYRWTGKTTTTTNPSDQWLPLINLSSIAGMTTNPLNAGIEWGSLEIVQAPSDATKIWAVFNAFNNTGKANLYYSIDSGVTWNLTSITAIGGWNPNNPSPYKRSFHIIMVDPANSAVVYASFWTSSGLTNAVYVATDGHTFSGVTALGTTTAGSVAIGMCFDASSNTVVGIGGLTVTKRALIPVSGSDVYETVDGGVTWVATGAATAFTTASFKLNCGVINSNGVYYCVRNDTGAVSAVWRYVNLTGIAGGGTWTQILSLAQITPTTNYLIIDPADHTYLSTTGDRGCAYGSTSLNADTGAPPTWTSSAGSVGGGNGSTVNISAPSYDLPWLIDIFNQGLTNFGLDISCAKIDGAGNTILSGNQSIWILPGRLVYNGPTNYTYTSFGRGQNATVAQEVWKPTGGNNPLIAVQDFGSPIGGTFTKIPTAYSPPFSEYTCSSIEESPTDGRFCVFRITAQGGNPAEANDASGYSTDASANVTAYATTPSVAWRGTIHGTITSYNSSTGEAILTVSSLDSGVIFQGQQIFNGSTSRGLIWTPISVSGGGTGTYNVQFVNGNDAGPTFQLYGSNIAGQIIAADNDHHLIVPAGTGLGCIPVYTTDRGVTWALCNGLPESNWVRATWFFAPTSKPLAVGFGADVGTVWAAAQIDSNTFDGVGSISAGVLNITSVYAGTIQVNDTILIPGQTLGTISSFGSGGGGLGTYNVTTTALASQPLRIQNLKTITIYKSTDWGANFGAVSTITVSASTTSLWLLAVPGQVGHLWFTGGNAGGLWQSTDWGASWTSKNLPSVSITGFGKPVYLSIGAIDPVSGTYPTIWMMAGNGQDPTQQSALFYSIDGSTSWSALGSHGLSGIKPDLPAGQQMYGLGAVRADRQIFKQLYCGAGQMGFCYYGP